MERKDEDLVTRLKKAQQEKEEIERRHEMNKSYQLKLKEIRKEE